MPTRFYGALSRHVGRLPDPALFHRAPTFGNLGLRLRYLGTAGFVLEGHGRTLVFDPYLTRVPMAHIVANRPLVPDHEVSARFVPDADDVLVGHAHYDHILDAPAVCARTGARLIGSSAVCHVGRAAGLPEAQLYETNGGRDIPCGAFRVRGLPSRHGKVLFGRVLFPGDITAPPDWPARPNALKHGLVLNWWVTSPGFSMVHIDSADFIRDELADVRADVLCLCAAGRKSRPRYVEEAIALLRPRFVVPCHWDTMLSPADAPLRMLPGIDLAGMVDEIRNCGSTPVLLPMHGSAQF